MVRSHIDQSILTGEKSSGPKKTLKQPFNKSFFFFKFGVLCFHRDLGTTLYHLQVLWMTRCSLRDLSGISNFSSLQVESGVCRFVHMFCMLNLTSFHPSDGSRLPCLRSCIWLITAFPSWARLVCWRTCSCWIWRAMMWRIWSRFSSWGCVKNYRLSFWKEILCVRAQTPLLLR